MNGGERMETMTIRSMTRLPRIETVDMMYAIRDPERSVTKVAAVVTLKLFAMVEVYYCLLKNFRNASRENVPVLTS